MKNKELRAWIVLLAMQLVWIGPCVYDATSREPVEEQMIESTEDVIRWRFDDVENEPAEITVETLEIEAVEQPSMESLGEFRLTAYCPCKKCCGKNDGITASGTVATQGRTIAVDPNVIPYGTVVVINGHEYIAEDSGGKWIQGKEIDIFMDSHSDAVAWGIQYAEVYVKVESNE